MKSIRPIVQANNYDDQWVTELFWEFMNAIDWIHQIQIDLMTGPLLEDQKDDTEYEKMPNHLNHLI